MLDFGIVHHNRQKKRSKQIHMSCKCLSWPCVASVSDAPCISHKIMTSKLQLCSYLQQLLYFKYILLKTCLTEFLNFTYKWY